MFDLKEVPQIPGIGTFLAGRTSERGADSAEVHVRAITDRARAGDGLHDAQHRRQRLVGA